ncbi:MAG: zinc ribbon domain-containing protein [Actinomycetota bacterium]|nr:zinc ribbon domain-containing protein [Actinomycetota bacterium]
MRCDNCGSEYAEGSRFCKECGATLEAGIGVEREDLEAKEKQFPTVARFFSILWSRKGPILTALFMVLMMAMVYAPWASIKVELIGFSLVSRNYSGWELYIPRIFLYLSIIPLLISLLMVAGIGTRRRVVETHICAFLGGVMFTIWITVFALSSVIKAVIKDVRFMQVNVAGGQVVTIFLFVGFILGIIITSYDRGRELAYKGEGG